jgi:hypothetical protein
MGEVVRGQLDEVGRRGVVAGGVEPARRRVVRVDQAQRPRLGVHHRHEAGHRPPGDVVGQVLGGVVGARQHHRQQQIPDGRLLSGHQPQLRVPGRGDVVILGEHRAQLGHMLQGHQRGHQLRRRGDRHPPVGVDRVQDLTGGGRVERGGGHGQSRGRRGGSRRGRRTGRARRHQRGAAARHRGPQPRSRPPDQRLSLSRCPACRELGEPASDGFSEVSRLIGTPVRAAMALSVSPGLTL